MLAVAKGFTDGALCESDHRLCDSLRAAEKKHVLLLHQAMIGTILDGLPE